jgi:hypothetical protein
MPPARRLPVVPRPQAGELSGSYLARLAMANRTDPHTLIGLLGRVTAHVPADEQHLAIMVLTLNEAAFSRLLTYTGHVADRLVRAIPSLMPKTFKAPGELPAVRISFLKEPTVECPGCRLRRNGAYLDTRLFSHRTACLRHGYWLYGQGSGDRLDFALLPEVAVAQQRLNRATLRYGSVNTMHAYRIAVGYLGHAWRINYHPPWYPAMIARWQQRTRTGGVLPARETWQLPDWAMHSECMALTCLFLSPYWARLALPAPDRRHKLFYERLLAELAIEDRGILQTIRNFDPLPGDIQEQARWGRLLSDLEWGLPSPVTVTPLKVPFIDITDNYEMSMRRLLGAAS